MHSWGKIAGRRNLSASVRCRSAPFDSRDHNPLIFRMNFEQDAPVAHPATKSWQTLQLANISRERAEPHLLERG
jgi:hypothetical protein